MPPADEVRTTTPAKEQPNTLPTPSFCQGVTDPPFAGNIAVLKRAGSPSWDLIVSLPSKEVEISTQNLGRGLDFVRELLTIGARRITDPDA